MTLTQADDFHAESEALFDAVANLSAADFEQVTQFKGWTLTDVFVHLHFWNRAAELSRTDEAAFGALIKRLMGALQTGGMRAFENTEIPERGPAIRDAWIELVRDMVPVWRDVDPKTRLPWAGPSMSARSAITARQMETWAHGFEVFDILGLTRTDADRIKNIVVLGVNTFGWAHQVHGLDVPQDVPAIQLTAPSGAVWEMGGQAGAITGSAVDFAAVVTQTRAVADTDLQIDGPIAETWMQNAQCFAGPPETPPAPGTRHCKS